jgi:hypothetical protein
VGFGLICKKHHLTHISLSLKFSKLKAYWSLISLYP